MEGAERVSTPTPTEVGEWKGDSRRVMAIQEIGTRIVMEAQIESGAFASQNSGGPLNVTNILAAIVPMVVVSSR